MLIMWKSFKRRVASWIPEHISTKFIVWLYVVLDVFSFTGKRRRSINLEHNLSRFKEENTPLKSGFVENQNDWGSIHFGRTTMAFAGCEILAVYNALKALGHETGPHLMGELICEFERKGAALSGWIGTSPMALKKYFDKKGIKTRLVWNVEELSDARVTIATIYNDSRDLYSQIHTIAFTKEENGFAAHNAMFGVRGCASVSEAISKSSKSPKLICAIEIEG